VWCYKVRGSDGRLVVISSGFRTEREAQVAGERAKGMISSICHPNLEGLAVVTEEYETILGSIAKIPFEPEESHRPHRRKAVAR
jgi:hypothetical protein